MTELSRIEVLTLIDRGIDNSVSIAAYYGDVKLRNRVGIILRNLCRNDFIEVTHTSKGIAGSPINHYRIKPVITAKTAVLVGSRRAKAEDVPFAALRNFKKEDMLCMLRSS